MALTSAITSGAASSGSLARMLDRRWNQHRMRMEEPNTEAMALTSPGAPSEVTLVGVLRPRATMWRKNSVQEASDSLFPKPMWRRCLWPSASTPQHTSTASLAPWRLKDSKTASANR